tara:strand:+ start:997 stop:1383 length:387 start_codon:yes stop_codon:yes gene_type:complete
MSRPPNPLKEGERQVFHIPDIEWLPWIKDGKTNPDMKWAPLSHDSTAPGGGGRYLIRLEPGCKGPLHKHDDWDELYVIEGSFTDSDGAVLRAGDYAIFKPGSVHWTDSEEGATVIATYARTSVVDNKD